MSQESEITVGGDAIALIQATAIAAAGPKIITPEAEPSHVYLLAEPDKEVELRTAGPLPRDHEFGSHAYATGMFGRVPCGVADTQRRDSGGTRHRQSRILGHAQPRVRCRRWRRAFTC